MNSANDEVSLDGLRGRRREARDHRVARATRLRRGRRSPTSCATGCSAGSATGASRSRSSTTSIGPIALPESMLPVELPEITDFEPATSDDPDALPEPPLARAADWVEVELDLPGPAWAGYGDGPQRRTCARRTRCRSGPDRVGTTCATSIRPTRTRWSTPRSSRRGRRARAPTARRRPGSSTSTSAASSTRCCTCSYARFWHKVLFDLGHVSTPEPFQRLVNQGYILARRVHRRARRVRRGGRGRRARRRRSSTTASRSRVSSARWARA